MQHDRFENRRILIIDDNPAIHEDFRKILCPTVPSAQRQDLANAEAEIFGIDQTTKAGGSLFASFEVDSAFQGKEGLEKASQALAAGRPYALAFVDGRMPPGWHGVETIARLWEAYSDLQVVICTAYSDFSWDEIIQRIGQSDSLVILKKPFDTVEVLQLAHALTCKWTLGQQARMQMTQLNQLVEERTLELRKVNEQITRVNQSKSEFLANISHELLTPMNGILGLTEMLALTSLNENQHELLTDVRQSGLRLLGLIRDVLKFNTIESGKLELQSIPFTLRALCEAVAEGYASKAGIKCLELSLDMDAHLPVEVEGDPDQIKQILSLLIDNAVKFTDRGGIRIQVQPASGMPHAIQFAVIDTGRGIPPNHLEVLNHPFFQIEGGLTRQAEGIGMGLTLVNQLLRVMGGQLEIQSHPGRGSTFRFVLPLAAASKAAVSFAPTVIHCSNGEANARLVT